MPNGERAYQAAIETWISKVRKSYVEYRAFKHKGKSWKMFNRMLPFLITIMSAEYRQKGSGNQFLPGTQDNPILYYASRLGGMAKIYYDKRKGKKRRMPRFTRGMTAEQKRTQFMGTLANDMYQCSVTFKKIAS